MKAKVVRQPDARDLAALLEANYERVFSSTDVDDKKRNERSEEK